MGELNRRHFLQSSLAAAAALGVAGAARGQDSPGEGRDASANGPPSVEGTGDIVDVNTYMFQWPYRRLRYSEPAALAGMLGRKGVSEAWVGSFDGLLHKDIQGVNARLAEACREHSGSGGGSGGGAKLVPFGSINPSLPAWREDLRRCHEEHGMPGIRLHPNYHWYSLEDPAFGELLAMAAERGLLVQLVPWMQDERHHHPLSPVPTADLGPLPRQVKNAPEGLKLMLLNNARAAGREAVTLMKDIPNVYFDFAKLDVIHCLADLLQEVPAERVVFGSYSPGFYFESALLKLPESNVTGAKRDAILRGNARKLLEA